MHIAYGKGKIEQSCYSNCFNSYSWNPRRKYPITRNYKYFKYKNDEIQNLLHLAPSYTDEIAKFIQTFDWGTDGDTAMG